MMKPWIVGITFLTFSSLGWSGELSSPQTVLHGDKEKVVAKMTFQTPETGDVYIATKIGSQFLFLNQEIGWVTSPIPFIRNSRLQGEYPLFSVEAGLLPPGNYPLYQVVTKPHTDPFNQENWIGGIDGLKFLSFSVGLQNKVRVLPFNDLGMHCMSNTFSIFAILPPFNVVNAQVVGQINGKPQLLDDSQIEVRYSAVTDRKGSLNSGSVTKTDFWQYTTELFGKDLQPGEGLKGFYMPSDHPSTPGAQPLHYKSENNWFSAEGIPITPTDDTGQVNAYPMLRIGAYDKKTEELLGATDVVVPVSTDVSCNNCHATGEIAANDPTVTWTSNDDPDVQAQKNQLGKLEVQVLKNILVSHDKKFGTSLQNNTPVLCGSCHYTAALDLTKEGPQKLQKFYPIFSQAIHRRHGEALDAKGNPIIPTGVPVEQSCYQCHPGKKTQCQRGAMKTAGLECNACHGSILSVGGKFDLLEGGSIDGTNDGSARRPWVDLPRCQSCHTGDAVEHLTGEGLEFYKDGIRLVQAYKTGDDSASPLLAVNKRFAENENTLFRNSKGHNGIACEGCHGSTHAIWPNADPNANDNLTAIQLQGFSGTVIECDTCHTPGSLPMTTEGPHGLHNVNDPRWTDGEHEDFYKRDAKACQACHGQQLEGTALSKMATTRTFNVEDKTVTLEKGQQVSCDLCHEKPR